MSNQREQESKKESYVQVSAHREESSQRGTHTSVAILVRSAQRTAQRDRVFVGYGKVDTLLHVQVADPQRLIAGFVFRFVFRVEQTHCVDFHREVALQFDSLFVETRREEMK